MKKPTKSVGILLVFMMIATYLLPIGAIPTYAADISMSCSSTQSNLEEGDKFSIDVSFGGGKVKNVSNLSVNGAANGGYISGNVEDDKQYVKIAGLTYNGRGTNVTISLDVKGTDKQEQTLSQTVNLDATPTEEGSGNIIIYGSTTVKVEAGTTQKASIQIKNTGHGIIKDGSVYIDLVEPVDGINIKGGHDLSFSDLKPNQIKTLTFSVEVLPSVKAGIYKLNADIDGSSKTFNLKVDSNYTPPTLELSTNSQKVFSPGVTGEAVVTLKNIGDTKAKRVKVELVPQEQVSIIGGSNVRYIPLINPKGIETLTYKVKLGSKITTNMVSLQFKITCDDAIGEKIEDTQYVYLNTSTAASANEVMIKDVISPTGTYGIDQNFIVKFTVAATHGAENLKILVKGDEGVVPKSQNLFILPKLEKGGKKQYTVTMAATNAAVSSSHAIEISVEYGPADDRITINQYASAKISNPDKDAEGAPKKGTPKVIVGYYKITPIVVKAGEEFDLEIGFLNTNKAKTVHNLTANLTVPEKEEDSAGKDAGNVFAPVGASNTFYISDLAPGQTVVKKIRLYTIPSANAKTYQVNLDMNYEDDKGTEIKMTENIGIPVEQKTKVEIGDIQVDYGEVGAPCMVNATIYNTGKTNISNLMIETEGEGFTVQENKMFVGNFEKGATENYAPTIVPEKEGTLTGSIVLTYEDVTGEMKKQKKEFTIEVSAPQPMDEGMDSMNEEQMNATGGKGKKILIGLAVIGAIGVVATIVIRKKRKAKKEKMMQDEDE